MIPPSDVMSEPVAEVRPGRLPALLGIAAAVLGAVVLIGWWTRQRTVVQVLPTLAPMQFNTALGFCLAGSGLVLICRGRHRAAVMVSGLLIVLGALTLLQYVAGINLGIDELFVRGYIAVETSHPGRPSPKTAMCFCLVGAALVTRATGVRSIVTASLASLTLGIGAVVLVSYSLGITGAYGWLSITRMALHTAAGFIFVSLGLLVHEWRRTPDRIPSWLPVPTALAALAFGVLLWMALDVQQSSGAAGPTGRGLAILVLIATLLFAVVLTLAVVLALNALRGKALVEQSNAALADANAQLAGVNTQLSASNQKLARFAWIASHDLQAPLRNLSGFVGLLRRRLDASDPRVEMCLTQIENASGRMGSLIQDVLAYSQLQAAPEYAAVDLEAVLDEALANEAQDIADVQAVIERDGSLPVVWGHAGQLTQVLTNLVNNAVKYRGDAPPVVHIGTFSDARFHHIYVRDNGIGIAPRHHAQIFEAFKRLHGRGKYAGTGVGLAICAEVVEQHGGALTVDSEEGAGATFTMRLPREVPAQA